MLNLIKTRVYALIALVVLGLTAALKWQYASNKLKKEKINELKREARVAKEVSQMEAEASEFRGYQHAIEAHSETLGEKTEETRKKRGELDEDWSDSNYDTHTT